MKELDEKGFVFMGVDNRPYWCRMYGDAAWFFYWHPDNQWVTLRQVGQMEVWVANQKAIPDEQAYVYHKMAR